MKPDEIKIMLMKKGIRQVDIARKYKATRALVSSLIAGSFLNNKRKIKSYTKTNMIMTEISSIVGKPIKELWPILEGEQK